MNDLLRKHICMQTINEAAIYLSKSLPQDIIMTVESLEEHLFEVILDRAEDDVLNEKDLITLEEKQDDMRFVEQYLAHRIPNFHSLLDTTVAEYISAYITDE
jgi:hypothetical protein